MADRGTRTRAIRPALQVALVPALAAVAAVTLTPTGEGWRWGDPLTELRWYVSGLGSETTLVQLLGNLALLTLPASAVTLYTDPTLHPLFDQSLYSGSAGGGIAGTPALPNDPSGFVYTYRFNYTPPPALFSACWRKRRRRGSHRCRCWRC